MSGMTLKWIALVLMFLDHLGEFFPLVIPVWFRWLGRLSAPLFLFCLAQGMEKTHSRKRYLTRLWVGSAVMGTGDLLLTLWFPQAPVAVTNNIFSTMVVIGLSIWVLESFDDNCTRADRLAKPEAALGLLVGAQVALGILGTLLEGAVGRPWAKLLAGLLPNTSYCEGGLDVVILGLILYFTRKDPKKLCLGYGLYSAAQLIFAVSRAMTYGELGMIFRYFYQWMMIGSLPLMLCYNGKRGKGGGRFFYLFYPVHIWLLFVLSNLK